MRRNKITGRKSHTSRRRPNGAVQLRSIFTSPPFLDPHSQSAVSRLNLLYQIASVSIENTIGIRSPKGLYEEVDPKCGYPGCPLHIRFLTLRSRSLSFFCNATQCAFTVVKMQILICKNYFSISSIQNKFSYI
jgi:hypothetical protein